MASKKNVNTLKVLYVASEVTPYAKSGGLGDVAGALPKELKRLGVDVRVVFPKYRTIKNNLLINPVFVDSFEVSLGWRKQSASIFTIETTVPTYLVENDYYFGRDSFYGYGDDFERFAFFSKASVEFLGRIGFKPDIIHFNDWQTGPACVYLKDIYSKFTFYSDMKSLFTVHNLQYQGIFGRDTLSAIDLNDGYFADDKLEFHSNVNFMKAGLTYSDYISTVSETYAKEIQTQKFGYGLEGILRARSHQLKGITNGIDTDVYNPQTDTRIFSNYSADNLEDKLKNKTELQKKLNLPVREDVPVFGIISRLVDQKGFDLISGIIDELMRRDIQIIVLGTGDGRYEHLFGSMAHRNPEKMSANITFNEELAQQIYAASDFFLMPSLFEPCGLGQLMAMRYGSLPIVRKTGGLADTVTHFNKKTQEGNGFVFDHYLSNGLLWAIDEAMSVYREKNLLNSAVKNAMTSDFSWKKSAEEYILLYRFLQKA